KDLVRAEIVVRGPRSAIRKLEKDDASGKFSLNVVLAEDVRPGTTITRNLLDDLSRLPEIRNRGIALQRVMPGTVDLDVDHYVSNRMDVEVSAGVFEKSLDGKPQVSPPQVTARLLESSLNAVGSLPPLRISIEDELQARAEQAGGRVSFDAAIKSPWPGLD